MLFISASIIGIMFIVGRFPGNESINNEIASLLRTCICLISLKLLKNVTEVICQCFFDLLVFPCSQVKKGLAQLDAFSFFIMFHVFCFIIGLCYKYHRIALLLL